MPPGSEKAGAILRFERTIGGWGIPLALDRQLL